MGTALFKRGWGCQIELPPCTTAPRGRLPGALALSLPPDVGGEGGGLHRYLCSYTRIRVRIHIPVRALPSPRRRFQLKSTPGVGPDPACAPLALLSSPTVLISLPNRRVPVPRCIPFPFLLLSRITFPTLSLFPFSASLLSYVCIILLTRLYITVSFVW